MLEFILFREDSTIYDFLAFPSRSDAVVSYQKIEDTDSDQREKRASFSVYAAFVVALGTANDEDILNHHIRLPHEKWCSPTATRH